MMHRLIAGGFGALILSACVMIHVEEDDAPALLARLAASEE